MTTKDQIKQWFDIGVEAKAKYMIVVCDTFDHRDFPVWVPPEIDIHKAIVSYNSTKNMTKVMEVYKLELGWEAQSEEWVHNI